MKENFEFKVVEKVDALEAPKGGFGIVLGAASAACLYAGLVLVCLT